MKDEGEDFVSIRIPRKLFYKVSEEIGTADSNIVCKYIIYVLKKKLSEQKERTASEEDKKRIIKKLGKLGYF